MSKPVSFETTNEVRDTCLCLFTQRAARGLARRFDEALRPVGLTNQQFSLLLALNRPDPPAMGPVARLLAMDRTTLTAALKPLERAGLIQVVVDPSDRRSRLLLLTDHGRSALGEAMPIWRAVHGAVEASLDGLEPDMLRMALSALATKTRE